MTISISSKKELNNAKTRLQAACDELGIRLGKDDKKAQALVCALLNQPNWHVAMAKVAEVESTDSISKFHNVLNSVLSQDLCKSLPNESYLKSMLIAYLKIDSFEECLVFLNNSLQILETTLSAMLSSPSDPLLTSAITTVARDFCETMLNEMKEETPTQIQKQLQGILDLLTPKLSEQFSKV